MQRRWTSYGSESWFYPKGTLRSGSPLVFFFRVGIPKRLRSSYRLRGRCRRRRRSIEGDKIRCQNLHTAKSLSKFMAPGVPPPFYYLFSQPAAEVENTEEWNVSNDQNTQGNLTGLAIKMGTYFYPWSEIDVKQSSTMFRGFYSMRM